MAYLFIDEDDNETEYKSIEIETYTPKSLNTRFRVDMNLLSRNNYRSLGKVIGTIVSVKKWNGGWGMSFRLNDKDSDSHIECKAWSRDGCNPEKIIKNENKNCTVIGLIEADSFSGATPRFVLKVKDIEDEKDIKKKNDTKLNKLKQECEKKEYFKNKKVIDFQKIKKMGIITKKTSKGYTDFVPQLKIPLEITVKEISLESKKTAPECIHAISELQDMDIIIISRGGGDTSSISEYWDKLELFSKIRSSNVPIITAMAHREDKGDHLLITNVSDIDYPTPTAAGYEIKEKILEPIISKIDSYILNNIKEKFNELFNKEYDTKFYNLEVIFNNYRNNKIGGQILKLDNPSCNFIIIEKDGNLYRTEISYNDKLDITNDQVEKYREISSSLQNKNLKLIQKYFEEEEEDIINNEIKEINELNKLKTKFINSKPHKYSKYYCKNIDINDIDIKGLISLHKMFLWYKDSFIKLNESFEEIYEYFNKL